MKRFTLVTLAVTLLLAVPLIVLQYWPELVIGHGGGSYESNRSRSIENAYPGLTVKTDQAFDGYTLLSLLRSDRTILIDMNGQIVHQWEDSSQAIMGYLLEDGSLLRTGTDAQTDAAADPSRHPLGSTNAIARYAWDGTPVWKYQLEGRFVPHHDIEPMPNGNVLVIAWDIRSREEAIQAGMGPNASKHKDFYSESIFEIKPTGPESGEVVWEWHMWDHLVQSHDASKDNFGDPKLSPHRIDLNVVENNHELVHLNAIDYNPDLDQILLSAKIYGEIWIIDHSTTTAEAASDSGGRYGHGGGLLFRGGNPSAYLNEASAADQERTLFFHHDTNWITNDLPGAGNILIYNNGHPASEKVHSTVDEWRIPTVNNGQYEIAPATGSFSPPELVWTYQPKESSHKISGSQRLPNGNTLICSGNSGYLVEVNAAGEIVWEFKNFHNRDRSADTPSPRPLQNSDSIFRATRYPKDFPAFQGKDLTPLPIPTPPKQPSKNTKDTESQKTQSDSP